MGQLTRSQIVSNGLQLAGDTSLTTLGNVWLNMWLRQQYASWSWPFLFRSAIGVSLTSGSTSLSVGAGSNGITLEIQKIIDPIWVYDSAYNTKVMARVRTLAGSPDINTEERIYTAAQAQGTPTTFKVRPDSSTWGKKTLVPFPIPDKNYLLAFDYLEQPADISSDGTVPLYPNDMTMIQAVKYHALDYLKAGAGDALQVLIQMQVKDRVSYGEEPGVGDEILLDVDSFR